MAQDLPRPDRDRLSTLTALIVLAYGLVRIVALPELRASLAVLGLLLELEFNAQLLLLSLASALAVVGTDWILRSHPAYRPERSTLEHWIIPGLAALGIGALVIRLPLGPQLWVGLLLAAGILIAVLVAEFLAVAADDPRFDAAALSLRILAYLLLIETFFALRAAGVRAAFSMPLIFFASALIAWRLFRLADSPGPLWQHASMIGLVVAQIGWALHYWPLDPLKASLILGLAAYLAGGFSQSYLEGELRSGRLVEYALVGGFALVAILILA